MSLTPELVLKIGIWIAGVGGFAAAFGGILIGLANKQISDATSNQMNQGLTTIADGITKPEPAIQLVADANTKRLKLIQENIEKEIELTEIARIAKQEAIAEFDVSESNKALASEREKELNKILSPILKMTNTEFMHLANEAIRLGYGKLEAGALDDYHLWVPDEGTAGHLSPIGFSRTIGGNGGVFGVKITPSTQLSIKSDRTFEIVDLLTMSHSRSFDLAYDEDIKEYLIMLRGILENAFKQGITNIEKERIKSGKAAAK